MKLFFSIITFLFLAVTCRAQATFLNENFDISCATSTGPNYPTDWSGYCLFSPASVLGWNCSPLGGRFSTPGFKCNSYIMGVHYADTAWLFTSKLDLSGNNENIYLRYDSKYEFTASKLTILASHDYIKYTRPDTAGVDWSDIGGSAVPEIGPDDSLGWVTHFINLTSYKLTPLFVAFKYTSTNYSGGTWTIDNVMTTPWALNVNDLRNELLPITVLGTANTNEINLSCTFGIAGSYQVSLTDLMGREIHHKKINTPSGNQNISIRDLNLSSGMYFIKISNTNTYGAAKVVVQ